MKVIKINRIIKYLILSDVAFWAGWGLTTPIFAIFIVEKIDGGSVFVAGVAAGIYWVVKSFFRIPVGILLDNCPGEEDDYWFLVAGLFLASLVPFGFIFSSSILQIYLLQAIYGVGMAMALGGWMAIFTRHIDKGWEATEWGIDATLLGFGIGLSGVIGGWAVTKFGFDLVFAFVGLFGLIGVYLLFAIKKDLKRISRQSFHFNIKDIFRDVEKK